MTGAPNAFRPKKHLGQNFLVDKNVSTKIVRSLDAPDEAVVVEIGPGTGALTEHLLELYPSMIAVEVDERAVEFLNQKYPELDVRQRDVLDVDWAELTLGKRGYVIGNLPYYITSPILFNLIDAGKSIDRAVIMVQLEVAKRIVAKPRTKDYGILSVAAQLAGRPELLFKVSRNVFRPVPDVESAIVRLDFDQAEARDDVFVRKIVRTAFGQRRKMLRNSLKPICSEYGRDLPEEFATRRPEELEPLQFVELADFFKAS